MIEKYFREKTRVESERVLKKKKRKEYLLY